VSVGQHHEALALDDFQASALRGGHGLLAALAGGNEDVAAGTRRSARSLSMKKHALAAPADS
jgi:hypothetical protein